MHQVKKKLYFSFLDLLKAVESCCIRKKGMQCDLVQNRSWTAADICIHCA